MCSGSHDVSTETFNPDLLDIYVRPKFPDEGRYQAVRDELVPFPSSLAYGHVSADGPLANLLRQHGIGASEIAWFRKNAEPPDYVGYDCYPDLQTVPPGEGDFTRGGRLPLQQARAMRPDSSPCRCATPTRASASPCSSRRPAPG